MVRFPVFVLGTALGLGAVPALFAQVFPLAGPFSSQKEQVHDGDHYRRSLPRNARVAEPGLSVLSFAFFAGGEQLFGWKPWADCRKHPTVAPFVYALANCPLVRALWEGGDPSWCYRVQLECRTWEGKRWSECTFPGGCSRSERFAVCLPVWAFDTKLCWQQERRWGDMVKGKPRTRHSFEDFVVEGKKVKCLFAETVVDVTVYQRTATLTLTTGPRQTVLLKQQWQRAIEGRITLRLSPDCNWYYAKLRLGKQETGPGWRRAPDNLTSGERHGLPHWTDWNEEYRIHWRKRIEKYADDQFGETFIGPWMKVPGSVPP